MEVDFTDEDARSEATFTFVKEQFSKVEDTVLSPPCMIRNLPWKIMFMQRANTKVDRMQRSLGFFLQCNGDSESISWSCYANARLTIVSQMEGVDDFTRKIEHLFDSVENDWGFRHFMAWNDVIDPDKGFIKNDTVIFQVQVNADVRHGVSSDLKRYTGPIKSKVLCEKNIPNDQGLAKNDPVGEAVAERVEIDEHRIQIFKSESTVKDTSGHPVPDELDGAITEVLNKSTSIHSIGSQCNGDSKSLSWSSDANIPETDAVIVEHVTFLQVYVTDLKDAVQKNDKSRVECLLSLIRARVTALKSFLVEDVSDSIKGRLKEALGLAEVEVINAERNLKLNEVSAADSPLNPCSRTRIKIDWNPVPFHGKEDEWCHWWRIFECVIDKNETIDEEIKMKALNECLKDDAKDVLGDMPRTGENYKKAIEQLQNQYSDPLLLSETYYTQLELVTPANDLRSQRETVDKLRCILQNLDALRGKLAVDDHRITRSIIRKFPHEVLRWTLHSLKSSKPEVIFNPTPAELLGPLEDYLLVEEFIATHSCYPWGRINRFGFFPFLKKSLGLFLWFSLFVVLFGIFLAFL